MALILGFYLGQAQGRSAQLKGDYAVFGNILKELHSSQVGTEEIKSATLMQMHQMDTVSRSSFYPEVYSPMGIILLIRPSKYIHNLMLENQTYLEQNKAEKLVSKNN